MQKKKTVNPASEDVKAYLQQEKPGGREIRAGKQAVRAAGQVAGRASKAGGRPAGQLPRRANGHPVGTTTFDSSGQGEIPNARAAQVRRAGRQQTLVPGGTHGYFIARMLSTQRPL